MHQHLGRSCSRAGRRWVSACFSAACGGGGQKANFSDPTNRLEVVSWWVSPSEHPALEVLLNAFKARNSNAEVVDRAIAGGGSSNVQVALAARLQAGEPPDVWQTFLGSSLRAWVDAKRIADVSGVYASSGLDRMMPQALLDRFTATELFENTLLRVIGTDGWAKIRDDSFDWRDPNSGKRCRSSRRSCLSPIRTPAA